MPLGAGTRLGHYEVVAALGRGGMGEVYRARDERLGRLVALKVLPAHLSGDRAARQRFEREARAAASLSHPGIVPVFDVGRDGDVAYVVMELVEGESLRDRLLRGGLGLPEALRIGAELAEALAAAHEAGITHRDVKPGNVMLAADGRARLVDFGLASLRPGGDADTPTATAVSTAGTVLGTAGYMAPEQVRGEAAGPAADIFAIGCVLYEMVSGTAPFARDSAVRTLAATLADEPPPLTRTSGALPADLPVVLGRCLAKDPKRRFQSASDLAFQLRRIGDTSLHATRDVAATPASRRASWRWPAAAAVVLLAAAALAAWNWIGRGRAIDSLAILPFANASSDEDLDYLGDGIAERLINDLTQLQGLRVIPRPTVFRFRGADQDPHRLARELGVRAVLTGRVSLRAGIVTIQADLVDARSVAQLWGDRFERPLEDLLAVQREIAQAIATHLRVHLAPDERTRLERTATRDSAAYQAYLRGLHQWNRFTRAGWERSLAYFTEAVERDPAFALAYAGLGFAHGARGFFSVTPPRGSWPLAAAAAERALALDPRLAEAFVIRGMVRLSYDWDRDGADRDFRRALELNPRLALAHQFHSYWLSTQLRHDDAIAAMRRALALDPLSLLLNAELVGAYLFAGRADEAIVLARAALELDPAYDRTINYLRHALRYAGRTAEEVDVWEEQYRRAGNPAAAAALRRAYDQGGETAAWRWYGDLLRGLSRERYVGAAYHGFGALGAGDVEAAREWFEKAYDERSGELAFLAVNPYFKNYRHEPWFVDLVRRTGVTRQ